MQFQAIEQLNKKIKEHLLEDAKEIIVDYETMHKNPKIRVIYETGICLEVAFRLKEFIVLIAFKLISGEVEWHSIFLSKEDLDWIHEKGE